MLRKPLLGEVIKTYTVEWMGQIVTIKINYVLKVYDRVA